MTDTAPPAWHGLVNALPESGEGEPGRMQLPPIPFVEAPMSTDSLRPLPVPLETLWLPNANGIDTAGWACLAALPARVASPGV